MLSIAACLFSEFAQASPPVSSYRDSIWMIAQNKDKTHSIFLRQQANKWKPVERNAQISVTVMQAAPGGLMLIYKDNQSVYLQKDNTRTLGPALPGKYIASTDAANFGGENQQGLIVAVQQNQIPKQINQKQAKEILEEEAKALSELKAKNENLADKNKTPNKIESKNSNTPKKAPAGKSGKSTNSKNAPADLENTKSDRAENRGYICTYFFKNQSWTLLSCETILNVEDIQYACVGNDCYRIIRKIEPKLKQKRYILQKYSRKIKCFEDVIITKKTAGIGSEFSKSKKRAELPSLAGTTLLAVNGKLYYMHMVGYVGKKNIDSAKKTIENSDSATKDKLSKNKNIAKDSKTPNKSTEPIIQVMAQVYSPEVNDFTDIFIFKPGGEKSGWSSLALPNITTFKKPGKQSLAFIWKDKATYRCLICSPTGKVQSAENITKEINSVPSTKHIQEALNYILFGAIGLVTLLIFTGKQNGPRITLLPGGYVPGGLLARFIAFNIDCIPFGLIFSYILIPHILGLTPEQVNDLLWKFEEQSPDVMLIRLIFVAGLTIYWVVFGSLCEWIFKTTPGKRIFGLRVIGNAGMQASFRSILIRNTMKPIEITMISMSGSFIMQLVGIFILFAPILSPINQRMGDRMAQTVVYDVKKSDPEDMIPDFIVKMVEDEEAKNNANKSKQDKTSNNNESDNDFYA